MKFNQTPIIIWRRKNGNMLILNQIERKIESNANFMFAFRVCDIFCAHCAPKRNILSLMLQSKIFQLICFVRIVAFCGRLIYQLIWWVGCFVYNILVTSFWLNETKSEFDCVNTFQRLAMTFPLIDEHLSTITWTFAYNSNKNKHSQIIDRFICCDLKRDTIIFIMAFKIWIK